MPTQAKAEKIEEITDKLGRSTIAILVQTQGLNVKGMNDFRGKLRAAKIDLQVVKNTLLRIASERNNMSLDRKLFDGHTTVAFGYEDEVTAVKAVSDYVRTSKIVTIKSAILGSRTLSQKQVEDLSKISGGKNQAKAEVVGILQAPLTNIYSTFTAPLRDLCYVLQARADQLNSGQAAE
ncbi:MAG TPA: 50S ribosomal protein L10 [Ktedonobacteraceae bacterium]|nr:50S ribosomal protein L10 [Ktedonobacteraceae bacterium]